MSDTGRDETARAGDGHLAVFTRFALNLSHVLKSHGTARRQAA